MADLIDRAALLEDVAAAEANSGMGHLVASTLRRYVMRRPAVDAVEVVRCKDCKSMKYVEAYDSWICGAQEDSYIEVSGDFFCAYGERRIDATD